MLTAAEALALSRMLAHATDKKPLSTALINYYKELLASNKKQPVPTVRRMWNA